MFKPRLHGPSPPSYMQSCSSYLNNHTVFIAPSSTTRIVYSLVLTQDARDPVRVAQAYTPTCIWRNRSSFFSGTEGIIDFLTAKWNREKSYRLRKELFSYTDDRIAVQFWYEFQDASDSMRWKRCYGLEDWTFDRETGKMRKRMMSGNDILLGPDGNGEGRWFVDGVDVEDVDIGEEHW
ncbi:hypothetical protein ASPVEDRAFT_44478 [Aspergillus versicolor CBS 583.65]|uniref:DUF1348 domain protein n=1 Tax=Aspergillus versicolor CBS 583.65 TaxID=1036611 RepID=A0A1L9PU46_ASPVE|nr:uncharacterized protein ASPVEDRAFT_44478 [Aspergillus versicolor CBS 583.65]OJJ04945.1 hypothetical protein ASPVEDRAFT_44478 [Aspergillus versicolor CBS 583.65]